MLCLSLTDNVSLNNRIDRLTVPKVVADERGLNGFYKIWRIQVYILLFYIIGVIMQPPNCTNQDSKLPCGG